MKWLLCCALLISAISNSDKTFGEIKKQSQAKNIPILVVFSGSDWCRPCIAFRKNVLETDGFKQLNGSDFLLYKADFPRNDKLISAQTKSDNIALAEQYNPDGQFPKILLISAEGKLLKQKVGAFSTLKNLEEWLQSE